jgi:hypothetical protein
MSLILVSSFFRNGLLAEQPEQLLLEEMVQGADSNQFNNRFYVDAAGNIFVATQITESKNGPLMLEGITVTEMGKEVQ